MSMECMGERNAAWASTSPDPGGGSKLGSRFLWVAAVCCDSSSPLLEPGMETMALVGCLLSRRDLRGSGTCPISKLCGANGSSWRPQLRAELSTGAPTAASRRCPWSG